MTLIAKLRERNFKLLELTNSVIAKPEKTKEDWRLLSDVLGVWTDNLVSKNCLIGPVPRVRVYMAEPIALLAQYIANNGPMRHSQEAANCLVRAGVQLADMPGGKVTIINAWRGIMERFQENDRVALALECADYGVSASGHHLQYVYKMFDLVEKGLSDLDNQSKNCRKYIKNISKQIDCAGPESSFFEMASIRLLAGNEQSIAVQLFKEDPVQTICLLMHAAYKIKSCGTYNKHFYELLNQAAKFVQEMSEYDKIVGVLIQVKSKSSGIYIFDEKRIERFLNLCALEDGNKVEHIMSAYNARVQKHGGEFCSDTAHEKEWVLEKIESLAGLKEVAEKFDYKKIVEIGLKKNIEDKISDYISELDNFDNFCQIPTSNKILYLKTILPYYAAMGRCLDPKSQCMESLVAHVEKYLGKVDWRNELEGLVGCIGLCGDGAIMKAFHRVQVKLGYTFKNGGINFIADNLATLKCDGEDRLCQQVAAFFGPLVYDYVAVQLGNNNYDILDQLKDIATKPATQPWFKQMAGSMPTGHILRYRMPVQPVALKIDPTPLAASVTA